MSMLGDDIGRLLCKMLPNNSSTNAWIMLSRFNSDSVPVVVVMPVENILAENSEEGDSWCSFDHTIIDEVAPRFKMIIEENDKVLSDKEMKFSLWSRRMKELDQCLGDFLSDMEKSWFGSCKHLLLGEWTDNKHLASLQKKLMKDLKSKCKVDVHESILKLILGGDRHASQQIECSSQLILNNGFCVVGVEYSRKQGDIDNLSMSVSDLIRNAIHKIKEEDLAYREALILVPDFDIQMVPWENLPMLRDQELYRMPSVASICLTYERCCRYSEKVGVDSAVTPMIDPLDAYYVLNPDGDSDLSDLEASFGSWFKDLNLQGTTGTSPTMNELLVALKSHDLFIYAGHGDGMHCFPCDKIQELDRCAATFLIGCSSGLLTLNECYIPEGAPLYYLQAGSPFIVAILWDITDMHIELFSKAMLDACKKATCAENSEELEKDGDKRKEKIGSFMGQAREACKLKYLTGAAAVCYGVPTVAIYCQSRSRTGLLHCLATHHI